MKGKLVKYKNGWMVTYPINSVLVHPQDVVNLLDSMNGMEVEFEIVGIDIGSGISKGFAKIINKEPMQVVPHDFDYPTTTSDLIDSAIWSLPFDERIKCWDLIEKLVEEEKETLYTEEQVMEVKDISKRIGDRINYHFLQTDGSFDIPKDMPFMKEFLNEVKTLTTLIQSLKQPKKD
jgi:hypothetical protein